MLDIAVPVRARTPTGNDDTFARLGILMSDLEYRPVNAARFSSAVLQQQESVPKEPAEPQLIEPDVRAKQQVGKR